MNFHNIPKSKIIKGFSWESERIPYPEKEIKGDTYPMTWASDGHIYAGVGDPLWGKISFRRLWNKLFHNLVGE